MVNIPGKDTKKGETKCGFNPSTPPPKTGFLNVFIQSVIHWKPLDVITLGQRETDKKDHLNFT